MDLASLTLTNKTLVQKGLVLSLGGGPLDYKVVGKPLINLWRLTMGDEKELEKDEALADSIQEALDDAFGDFLYRQERNLDEEARREMKQRIDDLIQDFLV